MAISKLADGTYTVSYSKRHPETRQPISRRRKGVKSKAEAKRVYSDLVVLVSDLLKKQVVPTWGEFLKKYISRIDRENDLSKGTVYKRDKVLTKYTVEPWGGLYIDEITTQNIRDLLSKELGDKSESHKKFMLKSIRSIFQDAIEQGLVLRNPVPHIRFKVTQKIKAVLTQSQMVMLLQKAYELEWDWYPHYAVALYTGMRSGEMYALTWDKVDLDKRQILVNCSWSGKSGFKSTKSGDDRVVEIPNPLLVLLKELKVAGVNEDYVLPRLPRWDQGDQARLLRIFLKSIGLPEVRFHDLRASWATLLLGKGVAPSKVMAMGGWKDMDTMMIYMRKAGIDIKGATNCLDDMKIHCTESAEVLHMR